MTQPKPVLAPRQEEVVKLIAAGYSVGEIAETMGISRNTVGSHMTVILAKLGARNRTEVAVWWIWKTGGAVMDR